MTRLALTILLLVGTLQAQQPLITEAACHKAGGLWKDYGDGHTLCDRPLPQQDDTADKAPRANRPAHVPCV